MDLPFLPVNPFESTAAVYRRQRVLPCLTREMVCPAAASARNISLPGTEIASEAALAA
jgi:hypothetical protein